MIRWLGLFLWLWATPALAQQAAVRGGEHSGFTRLVIASEGTGAWQVAREGSSYLLRMDGAASGFDLSRAFDRISRNRVADLRVDPASGLLEIRIDCRCHAYAFAFDTGLLVIDIRDGLPPEGSPFERGIAPSPQPPPRQPEHYSWLQHWLASREAVLPPDFVLPDPAAVSEWSLLSPLRVALLREISRGLADGTVIAADGLPGSGALPGDPGVTIRPEQLPGLEAIPANGERPDLTADGARCIPGERLALAEWLPLEPAARALGTLRNGLVGEFDLPEQDAVLHAARGHLALGFGAETRQLLALLGRADPGERRLLQALSWLVDGGSPTENPFAGMEACGSAAALWAVLAIANSGHPPVQDGAWINGAAVVQAFWALPAGLRSSFAPALVPFFLERGDEATAWMLRDAVVRLDLPDPGLQVVEAGFQLSTGNPEAAQKIAQDMLSVPGSDAARAAILATRAAFAGGRAVSPGLAADMEAFLPDHRGQVIEADLRSAIVLAHAMEGSFRSAFAVLSNAPESAADLWTLAARGADDDLFLTEAIRAAHPLPGVLPQEAARAVATRLLDFGLPREALAWMGPGGWSDQDRLFAARAYLGLRDARSALRMISAVSTPEAESLRARAVQQLGDSQAAARFHGLAGDEHARARALRWAGDWAGVADDQDAVWAAASRLVLESQLFDTANGGGSPGPADQPGIAAGLALAESSAVSRSAVSTLLEASTGERR